MSRTPGVPRRSPIQVLTRPDGAWLGRSDGMPYFHRGIRKMKFLSQSSKTTCFMRSFSPHVLSEKAQKPSFLSHLVPKDFPGFTEMHTVQKRPCVCKQVATIWNDLPTKKDVIFNKSEQSALFGILCHFWHTYSKIHTSSKGQDMVSM